MTVNNAANLNFTNTPSPSIANITTLNIGSNGLIDLQNHSMLVDNTLTPIAKVKTYIDNAYNLNGPSNPNAGLLGDYAGRGGITSSVAKTSYANDLKIGIGYYDGAQQAILGTVMGPNSQSGNGTGIGANQILVRPTLTGDLNGDGTVDQYDVDIFQAYGKFNQGQLTGSQVGWQVGDFNGDGQVDQTDIDIFQAAGNFNNGVTYNVASAAKGASAATSTKSASASAVTLSGHSASPSTAALNPASGTFTFDYNPATGDVKLRFNGFTGFAGKGPFATGTTPLTYIDLISAGNLLIPGGLTLPTAIFDTRTPVTASEIQLKSSNLNPAYTPDGTDLGNILAANLDPNTLAADLTVRINYNGSVSISDHSLPAQGISVPEPTVLSLLGLGAMGLMGRRRKNKFQDQEAPGTSVATT